MNHLVSANVVPFKTIVEGEQPAPTLERYLVHTADGVNAVSKAVDAWHMRDLVIVSGLQVELHKCLHEQGLCEPFTNQHGKLVVGCPLCKLRRWEIIL